jgi:hypothetical protein
MDNDAVSFAMEWAVSHGLAVRPVSESTSGFAVHAPISLFPSPFPNALFSQALALQPILNRLVDALVMDPTFLETFIERYVQHK